MSTCATGQTQKDRRAQGSHGRRPRVQGDDPDLLLISDCVQAPRKTRGKTPDDVEPSITPRLDAKRRKTGKGEKLTSKVDDVVEEPIVGEKETPSKVWVALSILANAYTGGCG